MTIHSVSLLQVFSWIASGWRCLLANFGGWLLLSLLLLISLAVILIIPLLGVFIAVLLSPLLTAGLLQAAKQGCNQQIIHIEYFSSGFRVDNHRWRLLLLGVIMLGYLLLMVLILYPLSGALYQNLYALGEPVPLDLLGYYFINSHPLIVWLQSLAVLAGIAGFGHSVALVTLGGCTPLSAIALSSRAFIINIAPLSVLLVAGALILTMATIAFGLGFLVALPLLSCINYCSYRDIYSPAADTDPVTSG